jgi:hypothetical protein
VTRERDLNVVRRARTYALPSDGLVAALACLPGEIGGTAITDLAAWTELDGPLWARLPPAWLKRFGRPAGWDALLFAVRRARRETCRRAFMADPFCLGPGIAVVLLLEEEVRGWIALYEAGGTTGHPAVERALALAHDGLAGQGA